MPFKRRQIIPGRGEGHLAAIIKDTDLWNQNKGNFEKLTREVATYRELGTAAISRGVEEAMSSGNIASILEHPELLNAEGKDTLAALALGNAALRKLQKIKEGTGFPVYGFWARATILEPGVEVTMSYGGNESIERLYVSDEEHIGKTFQGKFLRLDTDPVAGGSIMLSTAFTTSALAGLVNPETLQPRVSLDVLGKG